jgi:YfiH family protein
MRSLPPVPDTFEWHQQSWGPALTCRTLSPVARHLFSSRDLELTGLDGWMALASAVGVAAGRVFRLKQVHGTQVVVIAKGARCEPRAIPEGDALISDDPSVALAVRAADCAPILVVDTMTGAAGAVHAGWRGTAAGIASQTVRAMQETFGTKPRDLVVAIGPAIADCCYDVGPELVDTFAANGHERLLIDRWFSSPPSSRGDRTYRRLRLDLSRANRDQLVLTGIPPENIHLSGLCTAIHLDVLTSFRAEGERAGRMAGVIRPPGVKSDRSTLKGES